jgi:hypothetical protein
MLLTQPECEAARKSLKQKKLALPATIEHP